MEARVLQKTVHDARKKNLKTNFTVEEKIEAFYKGGRVQLSNDGKYLYCLCGSTVKVVDSTSGKIFKSIGEVDDTDDFTVFSLSPDNTTLVTSSKSGLLRRWDCDTGSVIRTWKSTHIGPITQLAFHPNSVLLASGGSDGAVKVWDLIKQYCTHSLTGARGVFSVLQFCPDLESYQLYGAADDYKIHVWNLSTKQSSVCLEGLFSTVTSLDFSADNTKMISSGRDRVVFIWDLTSFQLLKTIPVFEEVEAVIWCPQEHNLSEINVTSTTMHFITAGSKGVLKVWNADTGSPVFSQEEKENLPQIVSAFYSVALDSVATVTYEHNILLYKLKNLSLSKQLIGNSEEVSDMVLFCENESHLAVSTNSALIKVFELATQDCQLLEGHTDLVLSLSCFPETPEWFASCAKDSTLKIWQMNLQTKVVSCMFTGIGHTRNVTALACCRLGRSFVVSGSADNTIKMWEIPEKIRLVVSCPSLPAVFTVRAHEKDINSIDVSPNNLLVATASQDKTAKIWKADGLDLCGTLQGHRKGIWCVQFSPVDQVVATSSADGTIKIWALHDYSCAKTFEGHDCSVLKFHFLSRGMQLLSSGSDGNIKLWNVKTNECMKTLDGHSDKVWGLVLSKGEEFFMSGGSDAVIIRWKNVTKEEVEELLKKEENLILQEQEIQNLLHEKQWVKALKKAIHLDQPNRALTIVKEILLQESAQSDLQGALKDLDQQQIGVLLKYSLVWNTNSKHCASAQAILNVMLKQWTSDELLKFPDIREAVEGLLPYTERHFQRMAILQQQGTFVDFLWNAMKISGSVS